ncbi:hypothetical protein ACEV74_22750 [Vibrio parahaemolyticus]|nr:hypothetical protein [Vibrio parahaemolyticus]HCG5228986.1 hypothetical protein [Vibrio parahaemolyticus]HCG5600700.1 hypothetical protein [Vibrio parahaemolyticus]HCG5616788.1 hypothetical protein [Vibrio parahaemolyticus]HCG7650295.1 hypothetical protein [Vibrio parahaemolyticus]
MDRIEKEIALVEVEMEKTRTQKKKSDATSVSLCLTSAVLFFTSDPSSSIKLALLGLEVKSLYAIYFLYLSSLMVTIKWLMCDIRLCLLINKYKKLLIEKYDEVPKSLSLTLSNDVNLRQSLFIGMKGKLDFLLVGGIGFPILFGYLYMGYELISFATQSNITLCLSGFIIVAGLNVIVLMIKSNKLDKRLKRYSYSNFEG